MASPSMSFRNFWRQTEPPAWMGAPFAYPLAESRHRLAVMCYLPKPMSAIVKPSVSHRPSEWLKTHEKPTACPQLLL